MKWTIATIRSRIDHHENAKKRNDPIAAKTISEPEPLQPEPLEL